MTTSAGRRWSSADNVAPCGRIVPTKRCDTSNLTAASPEVPARPGKISSRRESSMSAPPSSGMNSTPVPETRSPNRLPVVIRTACPASRRWLAIASIGATCPVMDEAQTRTSAMVKSVAHDPARASAFVSGQAHDGVSAPDSRCPASARNAGGALSAKHGEQQVRDPVAPDADRRVVEHHVGQSHGAEVGLALPHHHGHEVDGDLVEEAELE